MFRFFLDSKIEDPHHIVIKDKEIVYKLKKVLRKKVSDTFILFDAAGDEYEVEIKEINNHQIIGRYLGKTYQERELAIDLYLYQAILKKDKLEWVLQKATEIGVKKIIPIVTKNCVVQDFSANKLARYQKIINEATMQCGGKVPPDLGKLQTYEQAIKQLDFVALNLLAHERDEDNSLMKILKNMTQTKINLFIGPEGGFAEEEINLALRNSVKIFNLGKRILRAETAAIVSCGVIANY
jgi:16S rRNA (uracil1498-N3)-methyltransferase